MAVVDVGQLFYDGAPTNGTDAVQSVAVTGSPSGGTFTLTWAGKTTAPIAWNASALDVQAALTALEGAEPGDFVCSGGTLPGVAVSVAFKNNLGGLPQSLLAANAAGLTGGTSPGVMVSSTTTGVRGTYRGAQYLARLGANGVLYQNQGSRSTPSWVEVEVT